MLQNSVDLFSCHALVPMHTVHCLFYLLLAFSSPGKVHNKVLDPRYREIGVGCDDEHNSSSNGDITTGWMSQTYKITCLPNVLRNNIASVSFQLTRPGSELRGYSNLISNTPRI